MVNNLEVVDTIVVRSFEIVKDVGSSSFENDCGDSRGRSQEAYYSGVSDFFNLKKRDEFIGFGESEVLTRTLSQNPISSADGGVSRVSTVALINLANRRISNFELSLQKQPLIPVLKSRKST